MKRVIQIVHMPKRSTLSENACKQMYKELCDIAAKNNRAIEEIDKALSERDAKNKESIRIVKFESKFNALLSKFRGERND